MPNRILKTCDDDCNVQAMSSFLEVTDKQHSSHISTHRDLNHICILKSKENIFKPKCDKVLKKKLKKYRLRRDGKEDPDIIDVSKILISTLKIKSPNGQGLQNNCNTDSRDRLPKNYLFKMVRKSNECLKFTTPNQNEVASKEGDCTILLSETETNESRQMDAFKLLMESRNKSIGSNSPGKEKAIDENDEIQNIKQKELKSKRKSFLQEMANKKGYKRNQENEDNIDECIKRKLEKRANKFKEMITSNNSKKNINKKTLKNNIVDNTQKTSSIIKIGDKKSVLKSGRLQLFNFLSDDEQSLSEIQDHNVVSPEDVEFLKKLSPSIRKKENMLSYFKKVIKDTDSEEQLIVNNEHANSVIKVKFGPKHKKKVKKIDSCKLDLINVPKEAVNTTLSSNNTTLRKRKHDNVIPIDSTQTDEKCELEETNDEKGRPKRAVKKPIKYSDDILLSSSDEELHIFTPKKKKSLDKSCHVKHIQESKKDLKRKEVKEVSKDNSSSRVKDDPENRNHLKSKLSKKSIKSKEKCLNLESNKAVKLAPIFSAKSKLTPLEQEARQLFLKSGVPDKLKIKQKDDNNVVPWNNFYTTLHIQQIPNIEVVTLGDDTFKQKFVDWIAIEENNTVNKNIEYDEAHLFEKLLTPCDEKVYKLPLKHKPDLLLKCIKKRYLKFPVYRTFHLLKAKNNTEIIDCSFSELDNSVEIVNNILDIPDCPDKLTWNDKYKPMSSKQIIGNFESVKELKRWLESWSENLIKNKSSDIIDSDLSDFCFSDSDIDSRDAFKNRNNVLIISGQTGTGKTSSVYAVAAELAIKVIEVNASSKRTGKIMLQDLQEATQSHKVNRGNNKKEGSQSSQEKCITSKLVKKHGRPKKTYERKKCLDVIKIDVSSQESQTCSQESTRTEMSLILIDDADIVFEQDDGFGSAISQLINYSKRPVILITSSLTSPHLQKYISFAKIIKMNPLIPRMLGTWLDIMCLADTNSCYPGFGCKLLDYFKGDIRKTINFLQFYMISNKHLNQIEDSLQDTDTYKANIDDENSSMSWADQDIADNNLTKEIVDDIDMKMIVERQLSVLNMGGSLNLFDTWWDIGNEFSSVGQTQSNNTLYTTNITIEDASRILDTMSFIDCLDSNMHNEYNITSKPWLSVEVPSVMEKENMDCYNISNIINKDISRELISKSVSLIKDWEEKPKCLPSISTQRRRNKIVFQHNTLSKYLNLSASLDRRALALDYWSSCRTICRHEKNKTDNHIKRNNRFCHYLKSANILSKNDYFDCLSESLT